MTKEKLENYEPKGQLKGFPKEIIARMLECQEEQGNPRDISVFERDRTAGQYVEGFAWYKTKEGNMFWSNVLNNKDVGIFFKKYPKQDKSINIVRVENKENNSTPNFTYAENSCDIVIDTEDNSQEFKLGDKVIDIITGEIGKVTNRETVNMDDYPIFVDFNDDEGVYFTLNGRDFDTDKQPRLLHYRDDYNYDVIDFNNLPKRQEPKRWRAEKWGRYYYIRLECKVDYYVEQNDSSDEDYYDSRNYFKTEKQAQEVVDKLKEYFKQLINK